MKELIRLASEVEIDFTSVMKKQNEFGLHAPHLPALVHNPGKDVVAAQHSAPQVAAVSIQLIKLLHSILLLSSCRQPSPTLCRWQHNIGKNFILKSPQQEVAGGMFVEAIHELDELVKYDFSK